MKIKLYYVCVSGNRRKYSHKHLLNSGLEISEEIIEINDNETNDIQQYCRNLLNRFNSQLRVKERARIFFKCELLEKNTCKHHTWGKTNLITIIKGGSNYDTMKCSICGITGKRYGLNSTVIRDKKYSAIVYERCDDSLKKLKRKN